MHCHPACLGGCCHLSVWVSGTAKRGQSRPRGFRLMGESCPSPHTWGSGCSPHELGDCVFALAAGVTGAVWGDFHPSVVASHLSRGVHDPQRGALPFPPQGALEHRRPRAKHPQDCAPSWNAGIRDNREPAQTCPPGPRPAGGLVMQPRSQEAPGQRLVP